MAASSSSSILRRMSSQFARIPPLPLLSSSSSSFSMDIPLKASPCLPDSPLDSDSIELMAVPKRKTSKYKKGLRNGPRALKPQPVIVRCKACGRVKLPHFYCCSGERGVGSVGAPST